MLDGVKKEIQFYLDKTLYFGVKFQLVFVLLLAFYFSFQLFSTANSILFPNIDFKSSTIVNTAQQYIALNSNPFSKVKVNDLNQSIEKLTDSNKKGPETDLNIKLYGIVKSKEENVAIIGLPNEKQRSYKIGDKISGNLVVESIDDTFINLRRNGILKAYLC